MENKGKNELVKNTSQNSSTNHSLTPSPRVLGRKGALRVGERERQQPAFPSLRKAGFVQQRQAWETDWSEDFSEDFFGINSSQETSQNAPHGAVQTRQKNKCQSMFEFSFFGLVVILGLIHFVGFAGGNSFTPPGHLAGVVVGFAHGFLAVIALVASFFNKSVSVYEIHNTGVGYNAGFIIGLCLWFLSSKFYKIKSPI